MSEKIPALLEALTRNELDRQRLRRATSLTLRNLGKLQPSCAKDLTIARNRPSVVVHEVPLSHHKRCRCLTVMHAISPHKPYRVGRSRTGLGLFAIKQIKKGTKIIRYFGPLLDCRKQKDDAIENKYLFELSSRWTIDGSVRKNVARYINHSCRPNAESDVKPRQRKVFIRAIRNIGVGEEINYDYGTDYFKAYLKPIGCRCAACEKKRKKQRAQAREERLRLKVRAERKALREAKKAAAIADAQIEQRFEQKQILNGSTAPAVAGRKLGNGKPANGVPVSGRLRNGHARSKASNGRSAAAKPQASTRLRVPASAPAQEQQASA
jgi:uncharacterized protein